MDNELTFVLGLDSNNPVNRPDGDLWLYRDRGERPRGDEDLSGLYIRRSVLPTPRPEQISVTIDVT